VISAVPVYLYNKSKKQPTTGAVWS
jgi:hypothetical protein